MINSRYPVYAIDCARHYIPQGKKRQADPARPIIQTDRGKNFAVTRKSGILLPMPMEIKTPEKSLQGYFLQVVRQSFWQVGIYDATVAQYVADVLADFARADNLYQMRGRGGRKIDSVVEMLAQAPAAPADEADVLRQRRLRKYVGDYALFMSGIFRKYIEGKGSLDYYIQEGSRSYWTVSELDLALYRTGYYLYQELSTKFEYYSGALDFMRKTHFAAAPGEDPFAGFLRQIRGWMKIHVSEN
jgi:hypothetical protein